MPLSSSNPSESRFAISGSSAMGDNSDQPLSVRSTRKSSRTSAAARKNAAGTPAVKIYVTAVFVVVLLASMASIYKSSSTTEVDAASLIQHYLLAPTRLDNALIASSVNPRENEEEHQPIEIDKPLNIVLLYADDWRHDSLGIAGTQSVETPFLDWMATNMGMRFTHNCVTTSVCWISRATLNTGQYFSRHKAARPKDNDWYKGFDKAYPSLLKKAGYHVAHIGKWHTHDFGKIKSNFHHSKIYYGRHWFPGRPHPIHVTDRNEQDALEYLRTTRPKDPSQPFVLTVAFFAPHSHDGNPEQFCPQNKTMKYYQDVTLEPPGDMQASFKRLPQNVFVERNEGRHRFRQRFDTPPKYDKMLKNYYRLITGVDAACKAIWDELDSQGILNETMVIFTTDNGFYHGEHGLAGKWYPHEESLRVPLIVYDPRMPKTLRGTTNDDFTLNIDLAPTILGAANVSVPDVMQGQDLAPLYLDSANARANWRKEFFYEHPVHLHKQTIPASTALVRRGIKFIRWPDFETEQLFNLTQDPKEEDDQINNPQYASILAEMKARHDQLRDLAL